MEVQFAGSTLSLTQKWALDLGDGTDPRWYFDRFSLQHVMWPSLTLTHRLAL